jgi:hypothetical protein
MIIAIGGNIRGMMIDMSVAGPPVLKRERLYEPRVPITTATTVAVTETNTVFR